MELVQFIQVLLRRKWFLLAITSVAMVTTFLIARKSPNVYKARSQVATGITQNNSAIFSLDPTQGLQKHEIEGRFRSMEETMFSDRVLYLVSYELMLHDLERTETFRDLARIRGLYSADELRVAQRRYKRKRDSIQPLISSDELERKHLDILRAMEYDPPALREDMSVRRIPGTDYIGIEARTESPYLSAFLVNTLAQEFSRYYAYNQTEGAEASIEILNRVVQEKKQIFDEKMVAWERYSKNNASVVNVRNNTRNLIRQIELLDDARGKAGQEIFLAERSLNRAEERLPESERRPYLETDLSRGSSEIQLLRNRLERMNSRYVRELFQNEALNDSIEQTRDQLAQALYQMVAARIGAPDAEVQRLIKDKITAELNIEIAQKRINVIAQEQRRLSAKAGSFSSEDNSSYGKEVQLARDAYLLSLNRLRDAEILGGTATSNQWYQVSQLEHVLPPQKPEPSNVWLLTILSGFISLGLCTGIFVLLEYLDTTIKYPSRFRALTGLPVMGVLNRLKTANLDLVGIFSETQKNPNLENYKQLLRKIRFEINDAGARTILVTSTQAGVGKTSLLVSLGYSMSLNNNKVLLIDTNFKNHSLTDITGVSPALEKYINREISIKALISNSVFEGVDVIGCEGGNFSPDEILKGKEFEKLLEQLKKEYDHILMEGPDLNEYVDSKELIKYATHIIPVFAADKSLTTEDTASLEYLKSQGDKVLGAVLNRVEMRNLKA